MKKKPELFKRTGNNSSLTLRNFLNNLKENDLHYENKQITQCVFLGVLRLKPVPTIFSNNNVPSVSALKGDTRSKRIKNNNSNKELNKNVSKKNDINKVLGGKVTKNNPQKVKTAVKKVPAKKPNIKIKLNKDKKKTNDDKKMIRSLSSDKQEAISVSSESSKALKAPTTDTIIARPTIPLNTIISPTKFNPVQNLFDKLKQKIDEGYNEPGPSTTVRQQNKTKEGSQTVGASSKVCKINAKRQGISAGTGKKQKKAATKKLELHERLANPTQSISPITISDTESTGKKDKDDVIVIDDNNLLNIQDVTTNERAEVTEDIIFVIDDSNLAKSKERTSPRNKSVSPSTEKQKPVNSAKKHRIIIINEQKLAKSNERSETLLSLTDTNSKQLSEVIVISDEPKNVSSTCGNSNDNPLPYEVSTAQRSNDVIIIEEVREIRMSPRSRRVEQLQKQATSNANSKETNTNEVICITDETKKVQTNKPLSPTTASKNNITGDVLMNKSNSEQLNIVVEEESRVENLFEVAESLLKIIGKDDKTSLTVKKELKELNNDAQAEKPRQRKHKLKPVLLPPMLLNAPMLLRSELAPKKAIIPPRDKPRIARIRPKSASKLEGKYATKPPTHLITDSTPQENLKNVKFPEAPVRSRTLPLIHYKRPKGIPPSVSSASLKNNSSGNEEVIFVPNQNNTTIIKEASSTNLSRRDVGNQVRSEVTSHVTKQNNIQEVVFTEVVKQTASRLLRSDLHQKKTENSKQQSNVEEVIVISDESSSKMKLASSTLEFTQNLEQISTRMRKETKQINTQTEEDIVVVSSKRKSSSSRLESTQNLEENSPRMRKENGQINTQEDEDIVIVSSKRKLASSRLELTKNLEEISTRMRKVNGQINTQEDKDIVIVSSKRKLASSRMESTQNLDETSIRTENEDEQINTQIDQDVVVVEDEIESTQNNSPRLLRSDLSKKKIDTSSAELELDGNDKRVQNPSPRISKLRIVGQSVAEHHDTGVVAKTFKSKEIETSEVDDQIILVKDESKSNEIGSPKTRHSTRKNKDDSTEDLSIHDSETINQRIRTSPRLLRSELAQQKTAPQRVKEIDLDEIVVVSERRAKKAKDKGSERLLRSDLAGENVPVKPEAEEVVVLIHDEPKQASRISQSAESEETNKKKILVDESIILSEQNKSERLPKSPKSDTGQKHSFLKTPERINAESRSSPSRLLRSHYSPKQISVEVRDDENQISPRLRSAASSPRSSQNLQKNQVNEGKLASPRSLRSDVGQIHTKEQLTAPYTKATAFEKPTISSISPRSDNVSEKSLEILPTDQTKSKPIGIKLIIRKPVSSRLRRSEPILQISTQEEQLHCDSSTDSSKKKRKSPATKDISLVTQSKTKLKTPMLLRSELAQLKNGEADGPEPEEHGVQKKKSRRSKLRLLPDGPVSSDRNTKPKRKNLIDDLKKRRTPKSPQLPDSNSSPELPLENYNHLLPNLNKPKTENSAVDVDEFKIEESSVKCENVEETLNKPKSPKTSNKKAFTDTATLSPESNDLMNSETSPKQNRKRLSGKRKLKTQEVVVEKERTPEKLTVTETIQQLDIRVGSPKKVDTTVFDFDESEPEVVPLRLSSTPKRARNEKIAVEKSQKTELAPSSDEVTTPKAKKHKVMPNKAPKNDSKTKAQAKAKLIAMFHEKSPQKTMELPETHLTEKSTIIRSPPKAKNAPLLATIDEKSPQNTIDLSETPVKVKSTKIKTPPKTKNTPLLTTFDEKSSQKIQELPETPLKEKGTKIKIPPKTKNAPLNKSLSTSSQNGKAITKQKNKKSMKKPVLRKKSLLVNDDSKVTNTLKSSKKQTLAKENSKATNTLKLLKKQTSVNAKSKGTNSPKLSKKQTSVNENSKATNTPKPSKKQTSINENSKVINTPKSSKKQTSVNENSNAANTPKPLKKQNSPMKQTTITDMFSKSPVKKETIPVVESIFEPSSESVSEKESAKENTSDNTITEMPPPKKEAKILPHSKSETVDDEDDMRDDDSDCESRIEWIPEEYAEYKFKYSAKKMMSYKPIHKCKICLLILPSYYRLSKHKKEHAKKVNPYDCAQCDQAFSSIDDLTAHLRIHKGKHPYTCKKCDIGFWSKKSLDAHTPIHVLKKVKQPNKRFRCDVCAKEFSKLCDMERHTRVHTGEKPCVCNICNKRFQQSHNLSKHLLTHLHVKPYHCEICNKQFGRNDVLNRHLLTHSVDKPIKCPLCPKGFIRQTQLNNHMTKSHPKAALIDMKESNAVEAD